MHGPGAVANQWAARREAERKTQRQREIRRGKREREATGTCVVFGNIKALSQGHTSSKASPTPTRLLLLVLPNSSSTGN